MVWLGNHGESVRVVPGIWLGMADGVVEGEVLDEGGEEDDEGVPGEGLPHTHPPAKPKGNKLILLDQSPAAPSCPL